MASYGAFFQDLDLIMDRNLQRALVMVPSCGTASISEAVEEAEAVVFSKEEEVSAPFGNPFSSAASISLALNAVLTSRLVFTKRKAMQQVSHRGGVRGPAISAAAPSQKRSHSPMPVMASSKVQVALDIPAARPIVILKSSCYVSAFPEYQKLQGPGFNNPANAAGLRRVSIVWFRNDLRLHDNETLVSASRDSVSVLPVFCFDLRADKASPSRAKFLIECVSSLRSSLRDRGSDLVVRVGKPEQVLVDLAKSVGADAVYAHQEITYEELQAEEKVAAALQEEGVETKYYWGSTLFHLEDVPFKLQDMPDNRGGFKRKVQNVVVRDTMEAPQHLKGLPACGGNVKLGPIPSLEELGFNPAANLQQKSGGEEEALQRLQKFAANQTSKRKVTKRVTFLANFSPWLATGCLSPRQMLEDVKKSAEAIVGKASGTGIGRNRLNWLVLELVWRDFSRVITKKYGSRKKLSATASTASLVAA